MKKLNTWFKHNPLGFLFKLSYGKKELKTLQPPISGYSGRRTEVIDGGRIAFLSRKSFYIQSCHIGDSIVTYFQKTFLETFYFNDLRFASTSFVSKCLSWL